MTTTSLREEIFNLTIAYGEYVNDWEREQFTDKILKTFEKRIDKVEQRAIEYITLSDEGDPKATRELAETINDYATENCWRGMKIIITDFREMLTKE